MIEDVYKDILDNIPLAVALCDVTGNKLYANSAFLALDVSGKNNLLEKEITIDGIIYKLLIAQGSNEQAHNDFISTVSHELRTPLTSIRGFADTMLMSQDKLSKEQTNKFLTIIRNQSDRLTRLVENLLQVSNISGTGKLILKEIDFEKFIAPIILMFERKYPSHNYETLFMPNLPAIWADADNLEQIMTNLIDNASKYSLDGSTVTIKAAFVAGEIEIKVLDEGVLIPENQLEKIFNKFSRIDSPLTRKVDGSGLGLFITKALTEQMNGKIKAQNYDKGNVFTLTLPAVNIETQLSEKVRGEKHAG